MTAERSRRDSVLSWASPAPSGVNVDPYAVRAVNPSVWPQYPYDAVPATPEQSEPTYTIHMMSHVRIPLRDGLHLSCDVFVPYSPGRSFPVLLSFSPYTRQLQQTTVPLGQNEAGLTEFWVPRGYVHVVIDVRGTNESEGSWDMWGPTEQQDMVDVCTWVMEQPWCDGNIGGTGCSYFGMTQVQLATLRPPGLKATFAYDAEVDLYRGFFMNGGIPNPMTHGWLSQTPGYSLPGGRTVDGSGFSEHGMAILGMGELFDGPYFQERLSWPRLADIEIPTYFGCDWLFYETHLRGAFQGYNETGAIPKRLMVGPRAFPFRPWGTVHMEALRWYDHWLKGMDTGVMDGPPIQLWIQGENRWRGENEWPLARTEWTEFFLGGSSTSAEGTLTRDAGPAGSRSFDFDPSRIDALFGRPCLVYRTEALLEDLEVTGPIELRLAAVSTAPVTHWHIRIFDEDDAGSVRLLCKGWLRSTHRAVDPDRSTPWYSHHPHTSEETVTAGEAHEYAIEVWPMSNVFQRGHRLRLEIASSEMVAQRLLAPTLMAPAATNTVLEGSPEGSRILLPVIPST